MIKHSKINSGSRPSIASETLLPRRHSLTGAPTKALVDRRSGSGAPRQTLCIDGKAFGRAIVSHVKSVSRIQLVACHFLCRQYNIKFKSYSYHIVVKSLVLNADMQ